jgi:predicted aspartyl protease
MGKIVESFVFRGDKGKAEATALLDSGASVSLLRRDFAERLTRSFLEIRKRRSRMANGQERAAVSLGTMLDVRMNGKELDGAFYVVDSMPREAIIGVDFLRRWEISLHPRSHSFTIGVAPGAIEMA